MLDLIPGTGSSNPPPSSEESCKLSVPKRRSEDRREAVADRNWLRRRRDGGPRRDRCVRMIASERRPRSERVSITLRVDVASALLRPIANGEARHPRDAHHL